jgi:hypothetical protein
MSETISAELRQVVILDIVELTREKYVYPDIGEKIGDQTQTKLSSGGYDSITQPSELAMLLTSDLREISNDNHWSVVYDPNASSEKVDPRGEDDEDRLAQYLEMARKQNFGFEKVERLSGNIGYIDLRRFEKSEYGGETAVAAMSFVANCDALIFDLRGNHGGYPSMVQLITSYLYDPEPRHINTFYYRPTDDTQQFWTFPHVPGKRMPDVPVYVLTSGATGSGAEEFTYNLKHMDRARIIGEKTVGSAHPVTREVVGGCFDVRLPYGRPINPVTKGNWEGTGIQPHVAVPAEEALKTAHQEALKMLIQECEGEENRRNLEWVVDIVETEYTPVSIDEAILSRLAGEYGKRSFSIEDGDLIYEYQDIPVKWKLIPITETRFRLSEDLKFEFIIDENGNVTGVKITYRDGRPELKVNKTK